MNFISWGRPRIGSFCTAIRTRFRIQKFRIPFSLYQKFLVSQKVILARPKDTFSLRGGFDNAWLISLQPFYIFELLHQIILQRILFTQ